MKKRLSLMLVAVLAFGLVSLAAAQQQDQSKPAPNPLVQLLQNKGVLTAQEATAINQAATPAEQQSRLTQLLYSKGLITQDEYQATAAAEASRATSDGTWIRAAAHVSAPTSGEPEPAMAMPPQAPAAPAIIPAVAPVRVLTSDPPKAGGLVPDIKLGSGAKLQLYGFINATAAYDTSNPYGDSFELPGFGVVNSSVPTDVPLGLTSPYTALPGVNFSDTGPNGSPTFGLIANFTRMGANFEWPDIAGSNNTITGRIETDFEGNFSRNQSRNVSSDRTNMMVIRLAWARVDHKFSDSTTGFFLAGMDWTPFGSSTQTNILESVANFAYFGNIETREAQFRVGLWHDFGGSQNFKIGIEPAIAHPAFGNNSTDLGTQLGIGESDGMDSARPEVSGRVVFQWQLDKARGVAPAQIIFSGMNAKRVEIVNVAAIRAALCGTTSTATCPSGVTTSLAAAFPRGAEPSSNRWGADGEIQLPTRYATLIAKYYTGADLKWYFGGQVYGAFNDNRIGLLQSNLTGAPTCNINPTNCPSAFDNVASAPNPIFGWNPALNAGAGGWQIVPQRPVRTQGGLAQLSFPLSRIFDANPAGRNAGWILAFAYGTDQAKARDVRASTAIGAINGTGDTGGLLANGWVANSNGGRDRSDAGVATLVYKMNQYFSFNVEESVYLTRSTCIGGNGTTTGKILASFDGASCAATLFEGSPARYWHDFRSQFGPIVTF